MSEKPLNKQNRAELVATANGLGLEVADDATKAQIVAQIQAVPPAAPADAAPAGDVQPPADDAAPVAPDGTPVDVTADTVPSSIPDPPVQDVTELDDDSGLVTITRDITEYAGNGDWVDPFSGLRVHRDSRACSQSGAVRQDDDTAIVKVTVERAAELGA